MTKPTKELKYLLKAEKRQARKKMQAARAHWAQLAAHKLTQMGHPTTAHAGYAVLRAKIELLNPGLKGASRMDVFAQFVGEGTASDQLREEYRTAHAAAKRERRAAKVVSGSFYETREWRELRYKALVIHGGACQCCGATVKDGIKLHVDHIKPRSRYPALELEITNLQVLCEVCNLGKSNKDSTDWRPAGFGT